MPGLYTVQPKGEEDAYLSIPPVPPVLPPIDVPVRIMSSATVWNFEEKEKGQFTVTSKGFGFYSWVLKNNNELWLSARSASRAKFQLEPADGENFWKIKLPDKDLYLTRNSEPNDNSAELTFQPADGSDAQVFKGNKDREDVKLNKKKFMKK